MAGLVPAIPIQGGVALHPIGITGTSLVTTETVMTKARGCHGEM
jgi:hypothetical protein